MLRGPGISWGAVVQGKLAGTRFLGSQWRRCGHWVIKLLLGRWALTAMTRHICGDEWPGAHTSWDWHCFHHLQERGDANLRGQVAPAHRQWRKLEETEPERGC